MLVPKRKGCDYLEHDQALLNCLERLENALDEAAAAPNPEIEKARLMTAYRVLFEMFRVLKGWFNHTRKKLALVSSMSEEDIRRDLQECY